MAESPNTDQYTSCREFKNVPIKDLRKVLMGASGPIRLLKKSMVRRAYIAISSQLSFCARAVQEVYRRSRWRGLMEATHKATKIVWGIFGSATGLGLLALFFTYLWPLLGKRWWAIVFVSLLCVVLICFEWNQ